MMTNKLATDILVCPYNKAHIMYKGREQTHLVKCRRNYPDLSMVECKFNNSHRVPEPELKYHYDICSSRIGLEKHTFVSEPTLNKYPIPEAIEPVELWEDDDVKPYNPEDHCEKNPVLRIARINTQSSAKRRVFRLEERKRMEKLESSEKRQLKNEETIQPETSSTQLRRPAKQSDGFINQKEILENAELDIVELIEKIKLNSNVVVTPKTDLVNPQVPGTSIGNSNRTGAYPKYSRGRGRTCNQDGTSLDKPF